MSGGVNMCLSELGYKHQTVCHKYEFKNTETGVITNLIEGCWSHFRRSLPPCGIKEKFIDDYIASFLFQREKEMPFPEFVRNVANYKPTEAAFPHDYDDGEGDDEADVPQIEQEAVEIHKEDYDDPGNGADASEYSES
ncbi:uncharacterized protein MONOS_6147 [Monocercomonoides exilis]|uniref:uncharacterized protein n=1 Tax=Monocercomonoides exilis TaxID=2049356 RepID=UPI00355A511F|nr:hypothetical protein MONOS_6147 [Monocercomonoides exilis]|eukprot:MONOS_6147.1-p1 / transcript=MONOS_6147.1 / gene=MONOS_6147 / organism=Monocercomonoides_exilis_PA203 / gene_product=unspecified product / transcript_product=unspecified product / location=Mono_scaffold00190:1972-2385(-) / protein_length=137 / sequence_SO=supercontig / SO=protein_coding / is_pseudo=false